MPWCPRCDETFPEGPACPRCRARLVAKQEDRIGLGSPAIEDLPQLKVPRRYRRAFERLSPQRRPPQRLLVAAVLSLVFAIGFLLGRVGTPVPGPAVHALAPSPPLAGLDVDGTATYLVWSSEERLANVAAHDLYSGEVTPRATFGAIDAASGNRTKVSAYGKSVAVVVGARHAPVVAVAPAEGAPFGWLPGVEAAWASKDDLLVRDEDGKVVRWSAERARVVEELDGSWTQLLQAESGAVLRNEQRLELRTPQGVRSTLDVPRAADVLAVNADGSRAVVVADHSEAERSPQIRGAALWDGRSSTPVRVEGYEAIGAAFAPDGALAVSLRAANADLVVAIVDEDGHAALKPAGRSVDGCDAVPAWDARGSWVYVAPGNGSVFAVQATGGRTQGVRARTVGCGLAWYPG